MTNLAKQREVDVAIAGAGMTGIATALQLAELGLKVEVLDQFGLDLKELDKQAEQVLQGEFESRVSALTLASVELLKSVGAWQYLVDWRIEPYQKMYVWDGETRGEVKFDAFDMHEAQLGYIVENRLIVLALLKAALLNSNIQLNFASRIRAVDPVVNGSRHLFLDDGDQLTVRLLVGADGASSTTRKQLGLGTHEWDYGHHAVVATLEMDAEHQHCCWQRFTEDGPLALLPLADEARRKVSLVWSTSPAHAKSLQEMDEKSFCQAISFGSRQGPGRIIAAANVQVVPLRQRHAQHYVAEAGVLVGDAAHTIHPLAGQGVNLGFLDSAALADVLAEAIKRRESIGSLDVLRRYERTRKLENVRMSAVMEGFRRLFTPQPAIIEWARGAGMRLFNSVDPVKQHVMAQAMGLSGQLPSRMRRSAKDA